MTKFFLCLHKFPELWNLFSLFPMWNCSPCYFRRLFLCSALRKDKNNYKILTVILVPDFCPLKPEITWFSNSIGFHLSMLPSVAQQSTNMRFWVGALSMLRTGQGMSQWSFIWPLWRFDAKQRPWMEKVIIVRALPGISRRLDLLKRIYGRFPSADRIDCFARVPNLGKYI